MNDKPDDDSELEVKTETIAFNRELLSQMEDFLCCKIKLKGVKKDGYSLIIISRIIQRHFLSALEFQNMFLTGVYQL